MPRTSPPTERVVATMALLAERPDASLSLAELTRRLGVNKSTGHAILTSLTAAGWVLRDPTSKTYRLGPAVVALGRQAGASFPALDFARPALVELSREFAATCAALGVGDDAVTVLDQVADPRAAAPQARSGWAPRSRCVRRSARRWWRGRPTRCATTGSPTCRPTPAPTTPTRSSPPTTAGSRSRSRRPPSPVSASSRACSATTTSARAALDRLADELATHEEFLAVDLDPDRDYAVNVVNAPVFDHTGHVTLVLSLTGFARALRGRRGRTPPATRSCTATRRITDAPSPPLGTNISKLTVTYRREPRDARQDMEAVWVSRPVRSRVPLRSSVSAPSRTIGRAVHEDVVDAVGLGVEPTGAAGQVHAHAHVVAADGLGVEHDDVGLPPLLDPAALAQAVELRGRVGDEVDRLLERQHLALAHRLAQHLGGVVERRQQVEVGAGVGRADQRARVAPHLDARLPVVVGLGRGHGAEAGVELVGPGDRREHLPRVAALVLRRSRRSCGRGTARSRGRRRRGS